MTIATQDLPYHSKNSSSLIKLTKDSNDYFNYPYYNSENPSEIISNPLIIKYTDEAFPPELNSLLPSNKRDSSYEKCPQNYINEYRRYQWLRANSLLGIEDYEIVSSNTKLNPQEITQGELGSCYLLVALMGLCKYEERIKDLFITKERNSKGIYAMKLLIQGEYFIVAVDDYFPAKTDENNKIIPAFCAQNGKEIWAMIIEKCWAKINDSCYLKIWLGTPNEALCALSEAPCTQIYHSRLVQKGQSSTIWNKITNAIDSNWVICCNTDDIKNEDAIGIVKFHAYSIINYYAYSNKVRLLKLRNPIGDKEWKGDYSKESPKLTSGIRQFILKKDNKSEDSQGTFLISLEDYVKYFSWTFMSKYNPSYLYRYTRFDMLHTQGKTFGILDNYSYSFCQIIIETETNGTICLHQPQKRLMNKTYQDYTNPLGVIILAKLITDPSDRSKYRYSHIKSEFLNAEKLYLNVSLFPGEYHLLFRSEWMYEKDYKLVVSTYSNPVMELYQLPYENLHAFAIEEVLLSLAITSKKRDVITKDEGDSYNAFSIYDENKTGYGIIYYENNSMDGLLKVKLSFNEARFIRVIHQRKFIEMEYVELDIKPGTKDFLLLKMDKPSFDCVITWGQSVCFDYPERVIVHKVLGTNYDFLLYTNKNIEMHLMAHDAGYLVYVLNKNKEDYEGRMKIDRIEEMEEIGLDIEGEIILKDEMFRYDLKGKGDYFLNLKWKGKKLDYLPRIKDIAFKLKQ